MEITWRDITIRMLIRSFVILTVILQSLMPASLAIANEAGFDVSPFICSPSDASPSTEAKAHLEDLMASLGKDVSNQKNLPSNEHCSNCVISLHAILATQHIYLTGENLPAEKTIHFSNRERQIISARGPPVGGRAPPIFL